MASTPMTQPRDGLGTVTWAPFTWTTRRPTSLPLRRTACPRLSRSALSLSLSLSSSLFPSLFLFSYYCALPALSARSLCKISLSTLVLGPEWASLVDTAFPNHNQLKPAAHLSLPTPPPSKGWFPIVCRPSSP
ncbi:hypothetical protein M747DRAFT_12312 [Aspergillus niger ATCC 13496]|uniref:Uncharacterized protein n=1 Tax=Aspergillus niger ATCC 13496 TaxID=1353008 RepID=A0A370C531_ASPNG|nr:hypothetical protein M747DRAFT_12312 [Aspergillus niger ATCC 13496]